MKISRLFIEQFGALRNMKWDDIPPGLIIVEGRNEAGKSTLLHFLRGMLFGFPRKPRKETRGIFASDEEQGRFGGRMELSLRGEQHLTIERYRDAKNKETLALFGAHGAPLPEDALLSALGDSTQELFRTVYAFSLDELQALDLQENESVRDAIYSASLGTARHALPKIRDHVITRMDEIFRPRGKVLVLNERFRDIKATRKEWKQASLSLEAFAEAKGKIEKIDGEIASVERDLNEAHRHSERLDLLEKVRPEWIKLREQKKSLIELPPTPDVFPENGLTDIERIGTQMREKRDQLVALEEKENAVRESLNTNQIDTALIEHKETLLDLNERRSAFEKTRENCAQIRARQAELSRSLEGKLRQLGSTWSEEDLRKANLSLIGDSLEDWRKKVEGLESRHSTQRDKVDELSGAHNNAVRREEEAEALLRYANGEEQDVPETEQVIKKARALRSLRNLLAESQIAEAELRQMEQRRSDMMHTRGVSASDGKLGWFIPVASVGLLIVPGLLLALLSDSNGFKALGATQCLIGLLVTIVAMLSRSRKMTTADPESPAAALHRVLTTKRAEAEQKREMVKELMKDFDLSKLPSNTDLDQVEETLRRKQISIEREKQKAVEVLEEAGRQHTAADAALETAKAQCEETAIALGKVHEEWIEWLRNRSLPTDLQPSSARNAVAILREAADMLNKRDSQDVTLAEEAESVATFEKQVGSLLEALNRPIPGTAALGSAIRTLIDTLEDEKKKSIQANTDKERLSEIQTNIRALRRGLEIIEAEKLSLLKSANATDEHDFRRKQQLSMRKVQLSETVAQMESHILTLSGAKDLATLQEELQAFPPDKLSEEKRALAENIERLEASRKEASQEQGRLQEQLRSLQSDDDVARLRAEEESLMAEAQVLAVDWSHHALAKLLIDRTREKIEREHQPGIIQKASGLFRTFTEERYARILLPVGSDSIDAETQEGQRRSPYKLSRGTAEQLYLALRFGYILHRAREAEPLPVVMDDILVNFDPDRARCAVRAIQELSKEHQVLFFTCHPSTVEMFREVNPNTPTIQLHEGMIA